MLLSLNILAVIAKAARDDGLTVNVSTSRYNCSSTAFSYSEGGCFFFFFFFLWLSCNVIRDMNAYPGPGVLR